MGGKEEPVRHPNRLGEAEGAKIARGEDTRREEHGNGLQSNTGGLSVLSPERLMHLQ